MRLPRGKAPATETATGSEGVALHELPIRPEPRRKTHVAAVVVGTTLLCVVWSLAANENVEWRVVGKYLLAGLTLRGVLVTLYLTAISVAIGFVGGIVLAVMHLSRNWVLRGTAHLYVAVFRGVPLLVQVIFWGYLGALYPRLVIGVPFTDVVFYSRETSSLVGATTAAILALALNEIAYASEVIRGGILGVDRGQSEAAYSLGMTPRRTLTRVVLPQAMRTVIPPLGNEVITMLKSTSLVSVIAGNDLLTNLQKVYGQTYQVIPLLVVASIWYCTLTLVMTVPQRALERRFGRGYVETH